MRKSLGTTLPQKEAESNNFVASRDLKTKRIKSLNTIYDLNVGVVEKAANFTVNGKATVKDAAFFEGGVVGALLMPDGTPALVGDTGVSVTALNNGKLKISLAQGISPGAGGTGNGSTKIAELEAQISLMQQQFSSQHNILTSVSSSHTSHSSLLTAVSSSLAQRVSLLEQGNFNNGTGTSLAINVTPQGAINGTNVSFTLPNVPSPASSLMLFLNGQLLSPGINSDFLLEGSTVTLASPPLQDDVLLALYSYAVSVTSYSINEPLQLNFVNGGGINATLSATLNAVPNPTQSLMVFMNGQLLTSNEDFVLNEKVITFDHSLKEASSSRFFATYSY